ETLPVVDNYEADINDYLSDEEKEPEKPKKAVIKKKGKKPVVKATPKKAEVKKSEPVVLEEPKEEKTHAPLVDDLPEGKFDYYEGDDDNGESGGTFTENDEIYALYELLKATRDIQDDADGNPFAKKD
ncbi:MAG: hypothetical protein MJ111_04040, partial [Clostridia bacterium]|nr:hypothetical protein [Clostridia bacterium]